MHPEDVATMTIDGIIDRLKEHAGLAIHVDGRIFPIGLPADTERPAITYEITTGRQAASKDGPGKLHSDTFRFTVWADTQTQGRAVGTLLGQALQWLRDVRTIHNAIPGSANDDVMPDPFTWLRISNYAIWWRE